MVTDVERRRWQLRLIAFTYWTSTFCEGGARILIPLYFGAMGVAATKIGFLFLVFELSGLVTNLYGGFFVNRVGYRRSFLLSLILHSVASLGYCLVAPARSALALGIIVAVLRALRGVAKELIKTTTSAYFNQLRDGHLDAQILWGGKDTLKGIGMLVGGVLLAILGFRLSFVALAIPTIVAMVVAAWLLDDHREHKRVLLAGAWDIEPRMRMLAGARAFLYAGRDLWLVLAMPIYLLSAGVGNVLAGAIPALGLIVFGLVQPISGSLIRAPLFFRGTPIKQPWSYESVIPVSALLLVAVPLAVMFVEVDPVAILFLVLLYNVLAGVATTPHNELHLKFARSERASVDIACYKTVAQVGKMTAVFASGFVYDRFGMEGCLVASSAALAVSAALGWSLSRLTKSSESLAVLALSVDGPPGDR